jgi:hypothetical protein
MNQNELTGKEGFMEIGALAGLLVFLLMLPVLSSLWDRGMAEIEKQVVADHLSKVLDATSKYVAEHQAALVAATGPTAPAIITTADLRNGNHLLSGFADRNSWGQSYGIYVLQPAPDQLQAIILTYGGRSHDPNRPEFANILVPSTSLLLGGAGGFIPTGDLPGQLSSELRGPGWTVDLSTTAIPIPSPGHLGGLASNLDGSNSQDFLYRVAVPGSPELNAMQTELDMTDHAIRGVSEVQFEPHTLADIDASGFCNDPTKDGRVFYDPNEGLYLCQNGNPEVLATTANSAFMKENTVVTDGEIIPKPTCPAGTGTTPFIYATPSIVAEGDPAAAISSFQVWTEDLGTDWRVNLRVLTSNGWVHPGPNYGRVLVTTTCNH